MEILHLRRRVDAVPPRRKRVDPSRKNSSPSPLSFRARADDDEERLELSRESRVEDHGRVGADQRPFDLLAVGALHVLAFPQACADTDAGGGGGDIMNWTDEANLTVSKEFLQCWPGLALPSLAQPCLAFPSSAVRCERRKCRAKKTFLYDESESF